MAESGLTDDIPACRRSRRVCVGMLAVAVIAWVVASWFIARRLAFDSTARLIEREQVAASAAASSISANVSFTLAHMRNIPKVLAMQPEVVTILARMGPNVAPNARPPALFRRTLATDKALSVLASRLEAMVGELGVDQIWVINAAGDCIVSGGFAATATATGVNYVDREYFLMARTLGSGQQFAVGRTTNVPGIYHSAAVSAGGGFVGVVVVKTNVTRLSSLASDSNVFITDENGVVIIAGDAGMLMKAVPDAHWGTLSESVLQSRYRRGGFEQLAIEPVDLDGFPMYRIDGRKAPMLEVVVDDPADALKVWVYREIADLSRLRDERSGLFLLLLFGGCSVLACVGAVINTLYRGREHRIEIALVNAELLKLNDELRVQARFDALTGCCNRRYFFERLESETLRATRFAQPCCMAMLDIDHFKEVNDRYGHAAGDTLLKQFAQTVAGCLRTSDTLGRLGGEEFALLMPQTSLAASASVAERNRQAVESASAGPSGGELRFSVSIGVEQWRAGDDSVESLVARADKAMYAAKRSGRNRVQVGEPARF